MVGFQSIAFPRSCQLCMFVIYRESLMPVEFLHHPCRRGSQDRSRSQWMAITAFYGPLVPQWPLWFFRLGSRGHTCVACHSPHPAVPSIAPIPEPFLFLPCSPVWVQTAWDQVENFSVITNTFFHLSSTPHPTHCQCLAIWLALILHVSPFLSLPLFWLINSSSQWNNFQSFNYISLPG